MLLLRPNHALLHMWRSPPPAEMLRCNRLIVFSTYCYKKLSRKGIPAFFL
ncbi:hypothetical protein DVU_0301 [Nitratidesulfovibrio vulgaris str. Hildenborough]|uniref:Uncharacterized protein n=1 Tax=Nitratidesulfovibrio vulgaris (strain ATCC 29579 / DSM 644 / CCUG 34227 / NCIMB 8303 / VKM B-1760 / Hildenborough) TaxID=882 RepID=Q72FB3_NITV2|nr:hypothetical protein DVU_0301 [Nitratidesulfovibrio vulgaris str. Hildenborough]